jgi:2-methylcitrate dehydratase PrpD
MTAGHPSRELATALAAARFDDLVPVTIEHTEHAVLDWLGSVLAGSLEPPAVMAHQVARGFGESSEATMFTGGRASAPVAAFANGVAAHILELDDIHKTSTVHGGAPIISAALAVAEREHATGEEFLTAVAVGYEAAFRIGEAVNPSHYRFWHPTGTVATFGAAAAAGSILRLTGEQMLHAFGSAGTQAAGLWEFNADGAMSKHLHPGKAAMNGVMAADLARAGFTGASRILGGARGFFRAMCEEPDLARITAGLPAIGKIRENGYKLHACCGHTHSAIDLALALRGRAALLDGDAAARVESLDIETYGPGYEIVRGTQPRTPYQAKFSMAYCVAVALQEGRAGLEQFSGDRFSVSGVQSPGLAALLSRTHVRVAADLTSKYPAAWPARLTVMLRDGSRLQENVDYPRGTPENPIDRRALETKFEALVGDRFGAEFAARSLGAVSHLAARPNMAETFSELRSVAPTELTV